MNLKLYSRTFLWKFTFWSLQLFLITWRGQLFQGQLSTYFSTSKLNFRGLWTIVIAQQTFEESWFYAIFSDFMTFSHFFAVLYSRKLQLHLQFLWYWNAVCSIIRTLKLPTKSGNLNFIFLPQKFLVAWKLKRLNPLI